MEKTNTKQLSKLTKKELIEIIHEYQEGLSVREECNEIIRLESVPTIN